MEKFCFGTLARILLCCSKNSVVQHDMGEALLKVFDYGYGVSVDPTKISKLYNCSEGLSPTYTIKPAEKMQFEIVKVGVATHVLPLLDENKYSRIILAIRQVILDDADIKDETTVGIITKDNLRTEKSFDFLGCLSGFIQYTCVNVKNSVGKDFVNHITESYVERFASLENTISIENLTIIPSKYITKSLEPNTFLQAFHEIDAGLSLGLKNNNQLRLFRLECDEGEYSYEALNEFLIENIGAYVYSRESMKEQIEKAKLKSIAYSAIKAMRANGKTGDPAAGNDLAQILVYAFLEDVLGAPKIMSKVELVQENGVFKSKSDSIHFLSLEQNGKKIYELVYGAADISLGLTEAIDKAMTTVEYIAKDPKREKGIISGALLNKSFDTETSNFLKSVILPSRQNVQRPNMAFGVFIGYSIGVKSDVDHFEEDAANKLENDIRGAIPYIVQKINDLGLADRSFYMYFLPFNNAVKDKIDIMHELLLTGGDY